MNCTEIKHFIVFFSLDILTTITRCDLFNYKWNSSHYLTNAGPAPAPILKLFCRTLWRKDRYTCITDS